MLSREYIEKLAEEYIRKEDLFLVEIVIRTGNRILVCIDSMQGIRIDDCVGLSRFIESKLDREQEDFQLDVSSAGLDQPFRVPQQYVKNIGREVEIVKNDGEKLNGILVSFENLKAAIERQITVKEGNKKLKQTVREEIPTADIKTTKVSISFK